MTALAAASNAPSLRYSLFVQPDQAKRSDGEGAPRARANDDRPAAGSMLVIVVPD